MHIISWERQESQICFPEVSIIFHFWGMAMKIYPHHKFGDANMCTYEFCQFLFFTLLLILCCLMLHLGR